ncbi:hypothetical protein GUITHDRAFT_114052 [Guillardia theta CCMP2712]|uniref:Uncharacterized protein n=1 Tax=Guillardia theta (strain CCMP2712) TaxID=905079 RepID=L1IUQ1_GUITC|nr:hypothetical protein GUITHDRAFT_114052 [Guillardia theta CCMP2712]EKX39802.1 hypothetical protein GUITHDRAFT_114052 [Guillardia theta CCMP2712]|eukprot:XP_005826782.1 hypothetical protein GUITHDRAFT_114052 [Guillardia theta CCMP2712]
MTRRLRMELADSHYPLTPRPGRGRTKHSSKHKQSTETNVRRFPIVTSGEAAQKMQNLLCELVNTGFYTRELEQETLFEETEEEQELSEPGREDAEDTMDPDGKSSSLKRRRRQAMEKWVAAVSSKHPKSSNLNRRANMMRFLGEPWRTLLRGKLILSDPSLLEHPPPEVSFPSVFRADEDGWLHAFDPYTNLRGDQPGAKNSSGCIPSALDGVSRDFWFQFSSVDFVSLFGERLEDVQPYDKNSERASVPQPLPLPSSAKALWQRELDLPPSLLLHQIKRVLESYEDEQLHLPTSSFWAAQAGEGAHFKYLFPQKKKSIGLDGQLIFHEVEVKIFTSQTYSVGLPWNQRDKLLRSLPLEINVKPHGLVNFNVILEVRRQERACEGGKKGKAESRKKGTGTRKRMEGEEEEEEEKEEEEEEEEEVVVVVVCVVALF